MNAIVAGTLCLSCNNSEYKDACALYLMLVLGLLLPDFNSSGTVCVLACVWWRVRGWICGRDTSTHCETGIQSKQAFNRIRYSIETGIQSKQVFNRNRHSIETGIQSKQAFNRNRYSIETGIQSKQAFNRNRYSIETGIQSKQAFNRNRYSIETSIQSKQEFNRNRHPIESSIHSKQAFNRNRHSLETGIQSKQEFNRNRHSIESATAAEEKLYCRKWLFILLHFKCFYLHTMTSAVTSTLPLIANATEYTSSSMSTILCRNTCEGRTNQIKASQASPRHHYILCAIALIRAHVSSHTSERVKYRTMQSRRKTKNNKNTTNIFFLDDQI